MSKRKHISARAQTQVLVSSGRRCCLCYGLLGDFGVKRGQVAHLDGDASNDTLPNLVFLCLDHHDLLDSRTSESKGFLREEVVFYREVLYSDVRHHLPRPASRPQIRPLIEAMRLSGVLSTTILGQSEIRQAVEMGVVAIEPFNLENLRAASYVLTLGERALTSDGHEKIVESRSLVVSPGEGLVIVTREFLSLAAGVLGRLVPLASLQSRRLSVATGSHIDPHFVGRLVLQVENRSPRPFELVCGLKIAAVEFSLLASPSTEVYRGRYKGATLTLHEPDAD